MITTRGKSIEITDLLTPASAETLAQWIGCANVIRNAKTRESQAAFAAWLDSDQELDQRPQMGQKASHFCKTFDFLRDVPCQIRRNASSKWFQDYSAFRKGLRSHPVVRGKNKKRSCFITSELFHVQALGDDRSVVHIRCSAKDVDVRHQLIGVPVPFPKDKLNQGFYLSRSGRRFWLSLSYEQEFQVPDEKQVKQQLQQLSDEEILQVTRAYDAGIANQMMDDLGVRYHYSDKVLAKMQQLEQKKNRYLCQFNRLKLGNTVRKKKQPKLALRQDASGQVRAHSLQEQNCLDHVRKIDNKLKNIRTNQAHHVSKDMVEAAPMIVAVEGLKLPDMMATPVPIQCEKTGAYLPNGRSAKRKLNRDLASMNIGKIRTMARYKAAQQGKLLVPVPAYYSSQTCSQCGYCSAGNRMRQSEFFCLSCQYTEHADVNASKVIAQRVIAEVRSEKFLSGKSVRKISSNKKRKKNENGAGIGVVRCLRRKRSPTRDQSIR